MSRIEPRVTWEPLPTDSDYEAYDTVDWTTVAPPGVTVDEFGGACPVQGRGSIDDRRWYFRARGQHFQFHVARSDDHVFRNDLFYVDLEWPGETFSAGWMAPEDAIKCLQLVVALYRQEAKSDVDELTELSQQIGLYDTPHRQEADS